MYGIELQRESYIVLRVETLRISKKWSKVGKLFQFQGFGVLSESESPNVKFISDEK